MILAELERLEAVDDNGFSGKSFGPVDLLEEKAVTAEAFDLVLDCRGVDVQFPGDLPVGGAMEGPVEECQEEVGAFEPVGGGEGLRGEGSTAVEALEALDRVGMTLPVVEAGFLVPPALGIPVEGAVWAWAEGRFEVGGRTCFHARVEMQDRDQTQSPPHKQNL
jgi:hypothetical protein